MVQYIVQIIAFQVFFLLLYDVFLKKETFFNWNRAYLIGTSLLSLVLPFIKISAFKEIVPKEFMVKLPQVFIGSENLRNSEIMISDLEITQEAFAINIETVFYSGILIASLIFLFKIIHIFFLIYSNPRRWKGNVLLVKLINSTSAFSFFHYVFLGSDLKKEEQKTIIKHELIHVNHKHTFDLLFLEIQRIIFWFNPLVYMYQNRIKTLHEFIADREALKTQNKSDYYQNLLTQVFETQNVSFINAFFKKSLIKKRINMLSKSKSKQVLKLKYALLLPVIFTMLVFTTNAQTNSIDNSKKQNLINKKAQQESLIDQEGEVPFAVVDQAPTYEDCMSLSVEERKKCTSERIQKHVVKNFNADLAKTLQLKGRQRINVVFKIDEQGNVTGVRSRAPHPILEEEAIRVVSTIPKMIPGKHKGETVMVPYSLPIIFQVAEDENKDESQKTKTNKKQILEEVPFAVIDEMPKYPGCESITSRDEIKKCTIEGISGFILNEFGKNLSKKLDIKSQQRINVIFKINKSGKVEGVRARAAHKDLEQEAIRVVSALPKMIPGKHKGKTVIVPYSLPIIYELDKKKN